MNLTLTRRIQLLIEEVLIARSADTRLLEGLASNELTAQERNAIVDAIGLELCDKGFDDDSEPTAYGLELERLIDIINRSNLTQLSHFSKARLN